MTPAYVSYRSVLSYPSPDRIPDDCYQPRSPFESEIQKLSASPVLRAMPSISAMFVQVITALADSRPEDVWPAAAEVTQRMDKVIAEIIEMQGKYLTDLKNGTLARDARRDVLVIAHGHILRAFTKRWLGLNMSFSIEMQIEPGGLAGLSYAHSSIDERSLLVGMSFPKA